VTPTALIDQSDSGEGGVFEMASNVVIQMEQAVQHVWFLKEDTNTLPRNPSPQKTRVALFDMLLE
jgi:hypothetical protein